MKLYADQDVLEAKHVLYDEYSHELGDPQNRQESNNRSKAKKSVEDIYVAFQKLDEMKVEPCFAAVDIKRLPNFYPRGNGPDISLREVGKIGKQNEQC